MAVDIRIPHLGEGAESGNIVNILVKEGDAVKKDQTLVELENEKAVAPIPSTHAGTVKKILVKIGDKVTVGQAILSLDESGAGGAPSAAPAAPAAKAAAPAARSAEPAPAPRTASADEYRYSSPSGAPPPASPTVRRVAQDLGIDLFRVRGSEAGGRIGMQDLKAYIAGLQDAASRDASAPAAHAAPQRAAAPAEKIDFAKWGPVERKPLTSLRQKIAQKMSESWSSVVHVTQFDEADITSLMASRKKYVAAYDKQGAALTITPFLMKAAVSALAKYPVFNSSLDGEELVTKKYFHLGVAVDTESGLIVPVIRDADKKSLLDLAKDLATAAEKTRSRKISIDDLKGGTFTISNLGSIGGTHFTPIVNVPEVAILGVGRGVMKPVVTKDKTVEPRLMLPLCLSYDHRVVDGADGARFVRHVVEFLENFQEKDVKI